MDSGSEFRTSGPSELRSVDWNNAYHRRSVAACLVQGVYVLEYDRLEGRRGSKSLAPPWWQFFHFELIEPPLVDIDDGSIFGAIFRYSPPANSYNYHRTIDRRPPLFVIAFRGSIMEYPSSLKKDFVLDIKIIKNQLRSTTRFEVAMKAVQDKVKEKGGSNLWLTGHSLGAAIAMLTGKTMAKAGIFLEAFLFNPPYVSPLELIKNKKVRDGLRFLGTAIRFGIVLAAAANDSNNRQKDTFAAISGWIPRLFVNQKDPLCSEYIAYFERRNVLFAARLTSHISLTSLALSETGILQDVETSEPLHLLPSANLTVNQSPSRDLMQAHQLRQWWRHDLNLKCSVYENK